MERADGSGGREALLLPREEEGSPRGTFWRGPLALGVAAVVRMNAGATKRPTVSQTVTIHYKQALVGASVGITVAVMSDSGTESDPPPFVRENG